MKISDAIITAISAFKHPEKRPTIGFARSLKGKTGIEIGGPSAFFRQKSYYPVYLYASRIDGVNFNASTVWEGKIEAGETYRYLNGYPKGKQYISEAIELGGIANEQYDFLLSCHSLEHIANPVKALKRWYEVLKPGGKIVVIVPNKEVTFDINRPYTTFQHLLDDYDNNVDETDNTHFIEVIDLHNIEKDPGVSDRGELEKRTADNFHNRCVHHHIFSLATMHQLLEFCGFKVAFQKEIHRLHLFTIAEKPD